ncbi:MAG: hypothetical protein KA436_03615 [Oligoflexales bacterium]|nr:hypothetical protein [Oligoflexales bacterium]
MWHFEKNESQIAIEQEWLALAQHEITFLEIELSHMHRIKALSISEYEKRCQELDQIKQDIQTIIQKMPADFEPSAHEDSVRDQSKLPQDLSLFEEKILTDLLQEKVKTLSWLEKMTRKMKEKTEKSLHSSFSFPFQDTLLLSSLRQTLSRVEVAIGQLENEKKSLHSYLKNLLHAIKPSLAQKDERTLGTIFYETLHEIKSNEDYLRLGRSRIRRIKEEINWKKSWLKIQERRIRPYLKNKDLNPYW